MDNSIKGTRMEKNSFEVYKKLVHEVAKGMKQVQKLQASSSSSGNQDVGALEKMAPAYNEALSILVEMDPTKGQCKSIIGSILDPPDSVTSQYKDSIRDSLKRKSTHKIRADSDSPRDELSRKKSSLIATSVLTQK